MPNRSGRTPANTGRSKLDLGAIIGGIAGMGAGGAADTTAGMGADDPAALASRGASSAAGSGVLVKPGFWSNVATKGQSGLNYQQYLYNQKLQEQQGGQALDQITAKGGEERSTKATEGEQSRLTAGQQQTATEHLAMTNAAIDYMTKQGIPFTPENYKMAVAALTGPAMVSAGNRASQAVTETGNADEYAKSDLAKTQMGVGQGAGYLSQLFKNLAQLPTVGMGQRVGINAPGLNYNLTGGQSNGATSTETDSFDPKTGAATKTNRIQQNNTPGSVSSQFGPLKMPPVDDSTPSPITTKGVPYDDQEERQLASPSVSVKPTAQSGYNPSMPAIGQSPNVLLQHIWEVLKSRGAATSPTFESMY